MSQLAIRSPDSTPISCSYGGHQYLGLSKAFSKILKETETIQESKERDAVKNRSYITTIKVSFSIDVSGDLQVIQYYHLCQKEERAVRKGISVAEQTQPPLFYYFLGNMRCEKEELFKLSNSVGIKDILCGTQRTGCPPGCC